MDAITAAQSSAPNNVAGSHARADAQPTSAAVTPTHPRELRRVIIGASLGTIFEWYDFFIYGILSSVLAKQFFGGIDETSAYIVTLLSFSAGTAIRPLGALVFGRYGDRFGRKRSFLVTVVLMGAATFCIGLLPGYQTWGTVSAFLLVGLRLLQGFALGGEYSGAAIYVAEHAPAHRRGFFTSWIQVTTPLGQLLAMSAILAIQLFITVEQFNAWGWRIAFLLSVVLLVISIWIRLSVQESPVFQALRAQGHVARSPLKETFLRWRNLRIVLLALFGLAAGQAVVINVGMTYSFFFMTQTLKVDFATVNGLQAIALVLTAPLFVVFGALSDRIGRKPLVILGLLLATLAYRPVFEAFTHFSNPALELAQLQAPVKVVADPATCAFQFNPTGAARFRSSCDIAKSFLSRRGVPYQNITAAANSIAYIEINGHQTASFDGNGLSDQQFKARLGPVNAAFETAVAQAGYPVSADPGRINKPMIVVLFALLMVFATIVYGPMAALLVEMFPAQIRFSAVATAYNIGNGWFGGFTAPIAFALIAARGDLYAGLWYCIGVTGVTLVIGLLFLRSRYGDDDDARQQTEAAHVTASAQ